MKFRCFAWVFAVVSSLLTLSVPSVSWGTDLIVSHNLPVDTTHFSTIQDAIDHANLILSTPATAGTNFRILVRADSVPYAGPITVKNDNVPIIGDSTAGTFLTGGASPLISVNGHNSVLIRNFTIHNATTGISIANSSSVSIENIVFYANGTAIQVQNSSSTLIVNNTFFNNTTAVSTGSDIAITNDIFSSNTTAISSQVTLSQPSYNDFFNSPNSGTVTLDAHSIPNTTNRDPNPFFVDPANFDFHLQSSSPCIGNGNPQYTNSFDSSSDMGAYGGPFSDIPTPAAVTGLASTLTTSATSATMTLDWDPTTSGKVTAYRVYYGTASRSYSGTLQATEGSSPLTIPVPSTSATLSGLPVTVPAQPGVPQNVKLAPLNQALQVTWDAVSNATGYRIFYGTDAGSLSTSQDVDGGSSTSAQISGLSNGTTYFVAVSALAQNKIFAAVTAVIDTSVAPNFGSATANESAYSGETSQSIAEQVSAPSTVASDFPEAVAPFPNLKSEGCFIATAAFGFYSAPQVQALRDFRDRYLLTNAPGRAFVAWYYHYGPRGAHFMNLHPWLKAPVRLALLPLIVGALVLTSSSPMAKTAVVLLALCWCALFWRRKVSSTRSRELTKLLLTLFLIILPALAQGAEVRPDRPHWSLELKGGVFLPDTANWSTFYGSSYSGEYGGALAYKVLRQVEVGVAGSYFSASGTGQLPLHGTQAQGGEVTFERAPLDVFVLARGVFNEDQLLVPYVAGGYTRLFYREEVKGQGTTKGSVNGYHARGGVEVLLDGLEPSASRSLYQDYGIHHTYLFLEGKYLHAQADTLPSGSVNIGGTSCLGGFLFEF